jgi:hypothetical protein
MRRSLGWSTKVLLVIAALAIGASRADAITLAEIIQLTKAGLDEDVLLALIEVDQRVFAIDPDTMKELKAAGVSPRVIVAIVKSGRTPQPQSEPSIETVPPDPPQPQVVVVDRPVIQEVPVAVPVPVYIAVGGYARGRSHDRTNSTYRPTLTLPPDPTTATVFPFVERREPHRRTEPVYWGWGGKLRPDAWQPTPAKQTK